MNRREKDYIEALDRRYKWLQKLLIQNKKQHDLTENHYYRTVQEVKALEWALSQLTGQKPSLLKTDLKYRTMDER